MQKPIVIAFTLKGQAWPLIKEKLAEVKKLFGDALLLHAFMPKEVVQKKGYSTEVVDALSELFPNQQNFYSIEQDKPLRQEMCDAAKERNAKIIVIGEEKEGVKAEIDLYVAAGIIDIDRIPL